MEWIKGQTNIGGLLTPEMNGKRYLLEIQNRNLHPFQVDAVGKQTVSIGRFNLLISTFQLAHKIIKRDRQKKYDWLIIDEVGPLELNGFGFEPEVKNSIAYFKQITVHKNLLLVVRQNLLPKVVEHYQLNNYKKFSF